MNSSKPNEGGNRMWWLSTDDKPEGPFPEDSIRERLRARQIPPAALVCPVGGQEWKLIGDWPEFMAAASVAQSTGPSPPLAAGVMDSPVTNRQLPPMANWICIYSLVVLPVYWLVSNLSCGVTGFTFKEDSDFFVLELLGHLVSWVASLGIAITLFLGGLRLRALRRSGSTLLRIGIWIDMAYCLLGILVVSATGIIAGQEAVAEKTPAADVVDFFLMIVAILTFAFEIVALIWLHKNSRFLPLQDK